MPRAPDAHLEERLVTAALCLLDEQGLEAVTMRAVAAAAGTSTPTLYERFADRDALLKGLVLRVQQAMISAVQSARNAEGFVKAYIRFSCRYRHRFELGIRTFGLRLASGEPMPVFNILRQILARETAASGRAFENLALAGNSAESAPRLKKRSVLGVSSFFFLKRHRSFDKCFPGTCSAQGAEPCRAILSSPGFAGTGGWHSMVTVSPYHTRHGLKPCPDTCFEGRSSARPLSAKAESKAN